MWPFSGNSKPAPQPEPEPATQPEPSKLGMAVAKASMVATDAVPVLTVPELPRGVVPEGVTAPIAMDETLAQYASGYYQGQGFQGYPYLASLSTRSEFRAMAQALSTELTREWIRFNTSDDEGDDVQDRIAELEKELARIDLKGIIQQAASHDALFGRGQIFIELRGHDRADPLVLSSATVAKGSLVRVSAVEAMWTTPSAYNALDPAAPDFYKPTSWYMLGKQVHASRLLTIITRPVADMLKPAFNFGGISLSQLAEPYVDNWLRTRQSVSDLVANFSTTVLSTRMDQVISGASDGGDLLKRAQLFTTIRSNMKLMLLDKEGEELSQVNTPLSGLHELQAQAQEQMCAVSRMPSIILTGISPNGMNASSEGELRAWYDWIAANQEAFYRKPIDTIVKVAMLSLWGEIDHRISFEFCPLQQMTAKEESDIRAQDANTAAAYIDRGVLDPQEERERLARDRMSVYKGIDVEQVPEQPDDDPSGGVEPEGDPFAQDADKWITVHPNGKDTKGTPAVIGENGEVKGGMGGKFNGKDIRDAHGTKEFTSHETNAETEARHAAERSGKLKELSKSEKAFELSKTAKTLKEHRAAEKAHHDAIKDIGNIGTPGAPNPETEKHYKQASEHHVAAMKLPSQEYIDYANELSATAKTYEDHMAARNAHVDAANKIGQRGDPEAWAHHFEKHKEHEKAANKLKRQAAKESLGERASASKVAEYSKSSSSEIHQKLSDKFGLNFDNGAGVKTLDKKAKEAWKRYMETMAIEDRDAYNQAAAARSEAQSKHRVKGVTTYDINDNSSGAKKARKTIALVDSALEGMSSRGFDVKAALAQARVNFVPGTCDTSAGVAWRNATGAGYFTVSHDKCLDPVNQAAQRDMAKKRAESGKPRWVACHPDDDDGEHTVRHELAHALGLHPSINSPQKLGNILRELHGGDMIAANKWVKANISEYATTNIKETDAELCAMVTSAHYVRGPLPEVLERHVYDLFKFKGA